MAQEDYEFDKKMKAIILLIFLSILFSCSNSGKLIQDNTDNNFKAVYTTPPSRIPVPHSTDAPFLGNGFSAAAISGKPQKQVYYLARNDFWRLKSAYNESFPAVLGKLELDVKELEGSSYLIEQDLKNAITYSSFTKNNIAVKYESFFSANDDILVIKVINDGMELVSLTMDLKLPSEKELINNPPLDNIFPSTTQKGKTSKGSLFISRAFEKDVDIKTRAACSARIIGDNSSHATINPGETKFIVVALSSDFKSENCIQDACRKTDVIDIKGITKLLNTHTIWWNNFWSKSSVRINDPIIEKQYQLSNYNMACFSRDPDFPPSIFGTVITKERPYWNGDYHLNYNHLAPYYGLFSSNHLEQAIPCNMPLLAFLERGHYYSDKIAGIQDGIMMPVGIGPLGIETTRRNKIVEENRNYIQEGNMEDEGLFFGQKSNSSYCVVNMARHFYTSYDEKYTELYYPFVKGVANFWEKYLVYENNRYVIYNDAIHEGTIGTVNPILSLGLIPMVMQTAIDMSIELERDKERRSNWQHILDNLSQYSFQIKDGRKVFRYSEKGTAWWGDNTLGIQHIYPAGQVSLDSDPELLDIATNTVDIMQRWIDFNGSNSFFPAAVRIGYDPQIIIDKLREYCNNTYPNGFQLNNPHGIENLSTIPNTINEMLCMGHNKLLRVFPVWDKTMDASFSNLRQDGAFLVSSELKNGQVLFVKIISEKGKACTLNNPWPEKSVVIEKNRGNKIVMKGQILEFETLPGDEILITSE